MHRAVSELLDTMHEKILAFFVVMETDISRIFYLEITEKIF